MAGVDPFGFESRKLNPNNSKQPEHDFLEDRESVDELRKLSKTVGIKCKSAGKLVEIARKKKALEGQLELVSKELENLKKIFIQELNQTEENSYRTEDNVLIYKTTNNTYTMNSVQDKIKLVEELDKKELITVNSKDFNSLCSNIFKTKGITPRGVKKSTFFKIAIRGI